MNFIDVIIPNLKNLSQIELNTLKIELDKVLCNGIDLVALRINAEHIYVTQKSGLQSIKYIKDHTGWSLSASKEYFDANIKSVEVDSSASIFNADALLKTTKYLIETQHKYNAVAHVKDYTGWSLDECKKYCDDIAESL